VAGPLALALFEPSLSKLIDYSQGGFSAGHRHTGKTQSMSEGGATWLNPDSALPYLTAEVDERRKKSET
jgi:hypothetical protein